MTTPSLARQWYPGRAWPAGAADLVRLAARARRRRAWDRVRTPGNAAAAIVQLLVGIFVLAQIARAGGATRIDSRWLLGAAGGIAVSIGVTQWRRRAARPPDESPWLVLGGDPRVPAAAVVLECAWVAALLMAVVAWIARPQIAAWHAPAAWGLTVASFAALVAVAHMSSRAIRRVAAPLSRAREGSSALPRTAEPARTTLAIAVRLSVRTLGAQVMQTFAFSALVGFVIIPGVYRIEGPRPAAFFAAALVVAVVLAWAGAARTRVGRQHGFLLAHRRQVPPAVWQSLAAGQALVIAGATALTFALVILGVPSWRSSPGNWTVGVLAIEWAVYAGLLSFWIGTGSEDALRLLLLPLAGVLALIVVLGKAVAIGTLTSPAVVAVAALGCAGMALRFWSRPPWRLRHHV